MATAQDFYDEGLRLYCKSLGNKSALWYGEAIRKFTEAINLESDFIKAFEMRVKCRERLGETGENGEDIETIERLKATILNQSATNRAAAEEFYKLGVAQMEPGGLIEDALYYLHKAIDSDPNFADSYDARSDIYFTLGMADESLADIRHHGKLKSASANQSATNSVFALPIFLSVILILAGIALFVGFFGVYPLSRFWKPYFFLGLSLIFIGLSFLLLRIKLVAEFFQTNLKRKILWVSIILLALAPAAWMFVAKPLLAKQPTAGVWRGKGDDTMEEFKFTVVDGNVKNPSYLLIIKTKQGQISQTVMSQSTEECKIQDGEFNCKGDSFFGVFDSPTQAHGTFLVKTGGTSSFDREPQKTYQGTWTAELDLTADPNSPGEQDPTFDSMQNMFNRNSQSNSQTSQNSNSADNSVQNKSPKTISGGVLNGKAKSLAAPVYSEAAKAARADGQVVVNVVVDETGNVISASAVSGNPLLRQAAVDAARKSKFVTTLLSGQPVKVTGNLIFTFTLPQ